jgi:hypothetical protein
MSRTSSIPALELSLQKIYMDLQARYSSARKKALTIESVISSRSIFDVELSLSVGEEGEQGADEASICECGGDISRLDDFDWQL